MFTKLTLILVSLYTALAYENRYLRGPGKINKNTSTILVPYYNLPLVNPKYKIYNWTKSSNLTEQRDL